KRVIRMEANLTNLPLFGHGTTPYIGDYIDIAPVPTYVVENGQWKFNTSAANSPVFQTAWTDNRDVKLPADGDWAKYQPPASLAFAGGALVACDPARPGMRNQNIYTSQVTQGLVVSVDGNTKPLGRIQRGFPVRVENDTNATKT